MNIDPYIKLYKKSQNISKNANEINLKLTRIRSKILGTLYKKYQ